MNHYRIRRFAAATAAVLLAVLMLTPVYAELIGTGVNLVNVRQNVRGDGYTWDNPNSTLTLDSLTIDTDDDFGLKIPAGARVVLKGDSHIRAGKYGIGAPGSILFEGDGTLTVEASEAAVYSFSTSDNHKLRFMSGKYTLTGGICAIRSDAAELSFVGAEVVLHSSGELAIDGRTVRMTGGSITSDATIYASHLIDIDRAELAVADKASALASDGQIKLSNMDITVGDGADAMSSADEYSGERAIKTVPQATESRRSIIFGDSMPVVADYIVLLSAIAVVAACIAVPLAVKSRRRRRLYERLGRLPDGSLPKNEAKK